MLKKLFLSERYDTLMFLICVAYCVSSMAMLDLTSDLKNAIIFGSLPVLYLKLRIDKESKRTFLLFLFALVVQVVSWAWSLQLLPNLAKSYPNIKHLTGLFLFVFIALWVGSNRTKQAILLITYMLSYIATAIYDHSITGSFQLAMIGKRVDYGMHNAQYTGMMAGVIMLLCVYFCFALSSHRYKRWFFAGLALVFLFALFSLVASQSRQVWVGLVMALMCVPLVVKNTFNPKKIIALYAFVLVIAVSVVSIPSINKRLIHESTSISKIVSSNWDKIPMTSFGIRFNSWIESLPWIARSPWVGASDIAIPQVIQQSELFQANIKAKNFGHLHNFYMETLVAYGLFGIIFVCVFYFHIVSNIQTHQAPLEFKFLLLFLIFYLLINNFESYNFKHYGVFTQNIILGCLYFFPRPRLAN